MKLKDEARKIAKDKGMLTTEKAAKFLAYSVAALKKWRSEGAGPAYYKGKGGMVFYERADLQAYKKEITLVRVVPQPRPVDRSA